MENGESGIALHLEDSPTPEDTNAVERILGGYNRQIGLPGWQSLTVILRDETGTVVGGLRGNTGWEWLYVDTLAVAEELRGQDWGTRLLAAAEQGGRTARLSLRVSGHVRFSGIALLSEAGLYCFRYAPPFSR